MNPDVTILYDSIRWEEKALLEAGKKKNINIQMVDCKKLALDLEKKQIGWGSQIRSYVLHPYKLIKDLRTSHESSNVNDVLDGEIDSFLEKSLYL